jgi:hypothetical protein
MTSIEMVTVEPTLGLRIYGDLQIAPRRRSVGRLQA